MKLSLLLTGALSLLASAIPYTDLKTGSSYSAFFDTTGYSFGIALPVNATGDFIGLVTGKGTGWSGISLGGPMVNKLLSDVPFVNFFCHLACSLRDKIIEIDALHNPQNKGKGAF